MTNLSIFFNRIKNFKTLTEEERAALYQQIRKEIIARRIIDAAFLLTGILAMTGIMWWLFL